MNMNSSEQLEEEQLPLPSFAEVFGDGSVTSLMKKKRKNSSSSSTNTSKVDLTGEETIGRWTHDEHRLFLEGIMLYGKDWKKMQPLIKTRTLVQIRTHAQKVFKKIGLKKTPMKKVNPTNEDKPSEEKSDENGNEGDEEKGDENENDDVDVDDMDDLGDDEVEQIRMSVASADKNIQSAEMPKETPFIQQSNEVESDQMKESDNQQLDGGSNSRAISLSNHSNQNNVRSFSNQSTWITTPYDDHFISTYP